MSTSTGIAAGTAAGMAVGMAVAGSSLEQTCYYKVLGENDNQMVSEKYEECVRVAKEDESQENIVGLGVTGGILLIAIFVMSKTIR